MINKHPQSTIVNINGENKIFYSEEYLSEISKQAYRNGWNNGVQVQFHCMINENTNESELKNIVDEFFKLVNARQQDYNNSIEIIKKDYDYTLSKSYSIIKNNLSE